MAKIVGNIGFLTFEECSPGVHIPKVTEKKYRMNVERFTIQNQQSSNVNSDINVSNIISIIADDFANSNLPFMKYVWFKGAKWNITSIEVRYPRLRLTIGGLYNGENGPESVQ